MSVLNRDIDHYFAAIEALSLAANRSDPLPHFLNEAVDAIGQRLRAEQTGLMIKSWAGEWFEAVTGRLPNRSQRLWLEQHVSSLPLRSERSEAALLGGDYWETFGENRPPQDGPPQDGRATLRSGILASIPCSDAGRGVLWLGFKNDRLFSDGELRFVRAAANLAGGAVIRAERLSDPLVRRVERAKQEWEATVDALPQVVCVLDRRGHLLRANQALEAWGLGRIGSLLGKEAGCLLHPLCPDQHCGHQREYDQFWEEEGKNAVDWEADCPAIERVIRLSLRRLPLSQRSGAVQGFAILVIEDITARREVVRLLERRCSDMASRMAEQAERLRVAHERLRGEIRGRRRDKVALVASDIERRKLSRRLVEAQEVERQRIARELHDGIGQSLTTIKLGLEHCLLRKEREGEVDPKLLSDALKRTMNAIEETRRVVLDLRPPMLDDLGLLPTLDWLCDEFCQLHGALELDRCWQIDENTIDDDVRVAVFRICQEALNNIAKHAGASRVAVSLRVTKGKLVLSIQDDGNGVAETSACRGSGFGLSSMRQRAELSGGMLEVQAGPGGGTLVEAAWPVACASRGVLAPRPLPRFGRVAFSRRMPPPRQRAGS